MPSPAPVPRLILAEAAFCLVDFIFDTPSLPPHLFALLLLGCPLDDRGHVQLQGERASVDCIRPHREEEPKSGTQSLMLSVVRLFPAPCSAILVLVTQWFPEGSTPPLILWPWCMPEEAVKGGADPFSPPFLLPA